MYKIKLIPAAALLFTAAAAFSYDFETADDKKTRFFNIGLEGYKFEETVKGPASQTDKGTFQGAFLRFTTYRPFGSLSDESGDNSFTFEARYAQSRDVKRSGPVTVVAGPVYVFDHCSSPPCKAKGYYDWYSPDLYDPGVNRSQWEVELRGLGGQKLVKTDDWDLTGSMGLGVRMHKDTTEPPSGGITMGSISTTYLYLPLGLSTGIKSGGLNLKINGEFDWVFIAVKKSGSEYMFVAHDSWMETNPYPPPDQIPAYGPTILQSAGNDFNSNGFGLRLSADVTAQAGPVGITISPFYRFWSINTYKAKELTNGYHYWTGAYGQPTQTSMPGTTASEYGFQVSAVF